MSFSFPFPFPKIGKVIFHSFIINSGPPFSAADLARMFPRNTSLVFHCSQVGPHLETRVPMGTFFRFWVPKRSPFFQGPHYLPFQAEERAKSQSSHYLLDVDNLNSCDDKTSFNLYTCTPNEATLCEGVFLLFISRN